VARIYANSLAFLTPFLISFTAHAVGAPATYREEQRMAGNTAPIATWTDVRGARFCPRQRGSPESTTGTS